MRFVKGAVAQNVARGPRTAVTRCRWKYGVVKECQITMPSTLVALDLEPDRAKSEALCEVITWRYESCPTPPPRSPPASLKSKL